jgi:hypothetical protein
MQLTPLKMHLTEKRYHPFGIPLLENTGNTCFYIMNLKWDSEWLIALKREFEGSALIYNPSETLYL